MRTCAGNYEIPWFGTSPCRTGEGPPTPEGSRWQPPGPAHGLRIGPRIDFPERGFIARYKLGPESFTPMGARALPCQNCQNPLTKDQMVCPKCGATVVEASPTGDEMNPIDDWDPVAVADREQIFPRARQRSRTRTGLLFMMTAFALLWIPYVSDLGILLAIVGVVFLFLGRFEGSAAHRRAVLLGCACVILALVLEVVVALDFANTVVSEATAPGATVQSVGVEFQGDLVGLFVATVATGAVSSLGYVALPYGLADRTSRLLLWGAMGMGVALATLSAILLLPKITSAVAQATSGGSIDLAPIYALQIEATLLGITQIVPFALFLWAYRRVRNSVRETHRSPGWAESTPSPYRRNDQG